MPRRLLGVFIFLLVPMSLLWAQGDIVLMKVGDEEISFSEFSYHWWKSSKEQIDTFAETYGRFKQKVLCAKELRLDTLSAYISQRESCLSILEEQPKGLQNRVWIKLLHITYPLKQQATQKEIAVGIQKMDSIYVALKSSSLHEGDGCEVCWMQNRFLLDEWRNRLADLRRGELSRPFFSPLGLHVVAWLDKALGNPGEYERGSQIIRKKEIEESLLVAYWDEWLLKSTFCSEADLMKHFKNNREAYGVGIPHFKGAVIHCQNKKESKTIKKFLKKYPEELWGEVLERMSDEISVKCKMDVGLFKIGKNPYVDKLAFGCGEYEILADYPYSFVLGRKMKKGPESYLDVRQEVEKDCLEKKKTSQMEGLMQKYAVEIDKEQLKSVNRAENK